MNIEKLRNRIKKRTDELNIRPAHDETGHWYWFGDQKYSSVTQHLQVLKDPGLMNWKMNRALEYLKPLLLHPVKLGDKTPEQRLDELIAEAKLAPQLEFEGAGDIGSRVHNLREAWFQNWITTKKAEVVWGITTNNQVASAWRAIQRFVNDTGYIPLACELYLADHKLQIGGTLDDIGIIGDSLVLIDLKTSNIGNKDSYYAQICLYLHMFRKLYRLYPSKIYILHVSKDNGTYELIPLHDRVDINNTIRWAKQVVEVSQGLDLIRETKKVKPVIL